MISNAMVMQLAADAFRTVGPAMYSMIEQEFQTNLCRAFVKMLDQGRLVLNLATPSFFSIKNNEKSACLPLPLPICNMPEHNKARLRATYTRAKQVYRAGVACLSPEQRGSQEPVKLSGSDASVNVALWPKAMQVNLGHEYICTKPHSLSDEQETGDIVQGAIDILNTLVAGLDEEWLDQSGVVQLESESQPQPELENQAESCTAPATQSSTQSAPRFAHLNNIFARAPAEPSEEYKNLVCDTFIQTRKQDFHSFIPVGLIGTDSAMNVGLYPRVLMAAPCENTYREDERCAPSSNMRDTDETVLAAIERLSALVNGVGYDWVSERHGSGAWQVRRGGFGDSSASFSSCSSRSSSFGMMTPPVGSQLWGKGVME